MFSIADLHCDLLSYLGSNHAHTAMNPECRCSLPQLEKGGVKLQTLAIYTVTKKGSVSDCQKQLAIFTHLPELYPGRFIHLDKNNIITSEGVSISLAIENASGLCEEDESLDLFFSRWEGICKVTAAPLYMSLTWNNENRFGGGNESKKGLKGDGERVLEYLSGKGVAIDLSHTSDALAHDILNYIDKKGLSLIPIASHSNFRAVSNQLRNLPNDIALEIVKRGGVIGLNFVRLFVGFGGGIDFLKQVEHARQLGALDHFCFGADFFYDDNLPSSLNYLIPFYFPKFSNASCYPQLLDHLSSTFRADELKKVAIENVRDFLKRL